MAKKTETSKEVKKYLFNTNLYCVEVPMGEDSLLIPPRGMVEVSKDFILPDILGVELR
jgi:hypothetical protein|nr:MAG TPA: hypothetical protein [Caudoviricetes sp.]